MSDSQTLVKYIFHHFTPLVIFWNSLIWLAKKEIDKMQNDLQSFKAFLHFRGTVEQSRLTADGNYFTSNAAYLQLKKLWDATIIDL